MVEDQSDEELEWLRKKFMDAMQRNGELIVENGALRDAAEKVAEAAAEMARLVGPEVYLTGMATTGADLFPSDSEDDVASREHFGIRRKNE